jgi:branched-chain amino acid transport system substrate-binding protein
MPNAIDCRRLESLADRRRALAALASTLLIPALAACGAREPLRIGFIGGMSGRVADLGIGGRNGAQLAVDDLNAAGGIGGRTVELVIRDDEQDSGKAHARLNELFQAQVLFVVGPMTSSLAVTLATLADQHGVPLISPTATTHELSGRVDAFFRVVPDAPTGATQQADVLLGRGLRRLVTVADFNNRAFSESWVTAGGARFKEMGGVLAAAIDFKSAPDLSYIDLVRRILEPRPDVVVLAASASDTSVLCQQMRRIDAKVSFASSAWAGTEQFPQMGGRAIEGALVAQYFERESKAAAYRQFVDRFQKRFGEAPGFPAVTGYDALMMGVEALRQRGEGSLLASLQRPRSYAGLQRTIAIDASGDSRSPMFMTEVREGRYVAVPVG